MCCEPQHEGDASRAELDVTDFDVAWLPILVLFTSKAATNEHLLTDEQVDEVVDRGDAIEVPVPEETFHCQLVSPTVYSLGTPLR
jgi:hypothetical protein